MVLNVHSFGIIRVERIRPFNNTLNIDMNLTTGNGVIQAWPNAILSTGNLVCHEIDGVTNVTMGVNFGVTGIKVDVKGPNGIGKSYPIDLNVDGDQKMTVDEDGVMLFKNGMEVNPHIRDADIGYVIGGDTALDDLFLYSDSSAGFGSASFIKILGNSGILTSSNSGIFIFDSAPPAIQVMKIAKSGANYTASVSVSTAWLYGVDTITTGTGVKIQCGGLTEGDGLQITVDSDIVTTGKAIRVLSGPAMTTPVFSVDEDGNIENPKAKITSIGGYAILLTNETGPGVASVAGEVVIASAGTADAVDLAGGNELQPIGVFLDSGVAEHAEAWVVVSGIAEIRMDGGGCALGDRIITSAVAGRGVVDNAPAVAAHFQEIGHAIQIAAADANARCVLHFN